MKPSAPGADGSFLRCPTASCTIHSTRVGCPSVAAALCLGLAPPRNLAFGQFICEAPCPLGLANGLMNSTGCLSNDVATGAVFVRWQLAEREWHGPAALSVSAGWTFARAVVRGRSLERPTPVPENEYGEGAQKSWLQK